ncbi:MAG: TCP-1/cpn60 chaperonin family protein [Methanosarcinales archaeon]|nr:TCP-1/cpn60 chaperonin family protein [Methanosarcinales archaeon]
MAGQLGGQPIFILREGAERSRGREAQNSNIMAARAVANAVRTTLGPKGMDKMLVDSMGDIIITNDGAHILRDMDIEHPAAKMLVEVTKTQDDEVGDGTTTVAVFTGELLKKAEEMLNQQIHPTIIAEGYKLALDKSKEILKTMVRNVSEDDTELLLKIAGTAITGKGAEGARDKLAELSVAAVRSVVETVNGEKRVSGNDIKIEKKTGASVDKSELIKGMVVNRGRVHDNMPKRLENAKILLLNIPVEMKKTEVDAEINITSPDQLKLFLDQEEKMLRDKVDKIASSGANVVFCQKGIDDMAQHYLAKSGIYAIRRFLKSDIEKMARATGASIINNLNDISESDLGLAGLVEERKVGGEETTYVTKCKNPKAVSVILRGGTDHVVDNVETAFEDSTRVVAVVVEDGEILAGGGSPEVELSLRLQEYAATLKGREQLAVMAFAEALEIIPRTLAENAGLDPIDKLVELRSQHERGVKTAGLNVYTGEVIDMWEEGVIEPVRIKTQALNSAVESSVMILRIDDVIASTRSAGEMGPEGMPPGGMPPGGMPDMDF